MDTGTLRSLIDAGQFIETIEKRKGIKVACLEELAFQKGYINKKQAIYYYNNAFAYVFPSIDEGFGIPLIEAMRARVPVICSDIEIFKEIGDDSVVYFKKQDYL